MQRKKRNKGKSWSEGILKFYLTTIEWTAPILAQANIATTSSIIIGMYIATLSPFLIPDVWEKTREKILFSSITHE